jgi:hypothetical protein
LRWLVSNYDCSCSTCMKLLHIILMFYVSFSLSWEPTHPPTTQVSKLELFLVRTLQKKIVIWFLTKCYNRFLLSCKPKQCLQRFLTLVVMYIAKYTVYCS